MLYIECADVDERSDTSLYLHLIYDSIHQKPLLPYGQFFSGVLLVWIESCLLPRLVANKEDKEPNLFYHLPMNGGKRLIHAFLKSISLKWNANNFTQNLNFCYCVDFIKLGWIKNILWLSMLLIKKKTN